MRWCVLGRVQGTQYDDFTIALQGQTNRIAKILQFACVQRNWENTCSSWARGDTWWICSKGRHFATGEYIFEDVLCMKLCTYLSASQCHAYVGVGHRGGPRRRRRGTAAFVKIYPLPWQCQCIFWGCRDNIHVRRGLGMYREKGP